MKDFLLLSQLLIFGKEFFKSLCISESQEISLFVYLLIMEKCSNRIILLCELQSMVSSFTCIMNLLYQHKQLKKA